jgi:hypothetical protein
MNDISLKDLVAINLRYSAEAESYRDMAYGQLATKALYALGNKPSEVQIIAKDIAQVLGIASVPRKAVERGLNYLTDRKIACKKESSWILTSAGLSQTSREIKDSASRISSVIRRHLPPHLNQEKLRSWFRDACVDFFAKYADHWVAATCRGTHLSSVLPPDLSDLLYPSIISHRFESEKTTLVSSFREFIVSSNLEDNEQVRCFGMAMYQSRLVAANVTADPITLELIRNSTILLDTNVLMVLQLEKDKRSSSLAALGNELAKLNASSVFIQRTQEEYVNTLLVYREITLKAISRYPFEIVRNAIDAFTTTALSRECEKAEDFERFFDSIVTPPSDFGDRSKVTKLDNEEIELLSAKGEGDEQLKKEIDEAWFQYHKRHKREGPLKHDAALVTVARHLRKPGNNCFILTLDMPLHNYGIKSAAPQEAPISLSLDALLQILAIGLAGTEMGPSEFAPLMANILDYQFEPAADAYTVEDLACLLDIEERCADLPKDRVQELANKINRARIAGKGSDDSELRIEVQRAFHSQKLRLIEDLSSAKTELVKQTEETAEERQRRKKAEIALREAKKSELLREAKKHLLQGLLGWSIAAILLATIFLYVVRMAHPKNTQAQIVFDFLSIAAPVIAAIFKIFSRVIPRFRQERASAGEKAQELVKKELE